MASDGLKLSLQMLPQRPAKKISTRPAVREFDILPFLDTNLTTEEAIELVRCHNTLNMAFYASMSNQ